MKRLVFVAMLSLVITVMSTSFVAASELVIKFGTVNTGSHPVVVALNEVFKAKVEELSKGAMKVQIFDSGSLGEEPQMLEQTQLGVVQMCSVSEVLSSLHPKVNILNLPYIFENNNQVDAVIDGDLGKKIFDGLGEHNLIGLGYFENGFRATTNSVKPITKLDDLQGMKIRTPQSKAQIAIFNAFGANVTPLSFTELYSALQQGVVDGQENGYNTIVSQAFYEVQSYIAETNHMWGSFSIVANLKWWDSLSEEDQQIIQKAVNEASTHERMLSRKEAEKNKQVCIDYGCEITYPDLTNFVKAVQPVYDNFYAENPDFKPLVEEIIASKKK